MNRVIDNIEKIRDKKGIKKSHIAKFCGHTPSWYTDIIKGKNRLSVDDLLLVADAMNENPAVFFSSKLSVTLRTNKTA